MQLSKVSCIQGRRDNRYTTGETTAVKANHTNLYYIASKPCYFLPLQLTLFHDLPCDLSDGQL